MTPLINAMAKDFTALSRVWRDGAPSFPTANDFARSLATAAIYTVDEAEFDTTLARKARPDHFNQGRNLVLPADSLWLEYKAYRSPIHAPEGRSAFYAWRIPSGDVRVMGVSWVPAANLLAAVQFFDFPGSMIGAAGSIEGARYDLRNALLLPNIDRAANFFMELVMFLRLPPEDVIAEARNPLPATQRRLRAELGPDFTLKPWTALRYAHSPDVEVAA